MYIDVPIDTRRKALKILSKDTPTNEDILWFKEEAKKYKNTDETDFVSDYEEDRIVMLLNTELYSFRLISQITEVKLRTVVNIAKKRNYHARNRRNLDSI